MDSVFIISPIVGSIIGYCTNWLAIKMLFRPLTKKEIFGFKIPFTPGVIPRRRGELAESIGDTVGKRLLTADAFEKILQGSVMKSKVKEFIRDKIQNLESETRNLEEILNQVSNDDSQAIQMKKLIKSIINNSIRDSLISNKLVELIESKLNSKETIDQVEDYFNSTEYMESKEKIIEWIEQRSIKQYLSKKLSSYLKQELATVDDEKTIKDLIPEELIVTIKNWVKKQKPEVMKQLADFLNSDVLKDQIEEKVENFFDNNPMLSMLSGFKDTIVEKFLNYLISFAEEEKNQEKIMEQIEELIDSMLETKITTITTQLDEKKLESLSKKIIAEMIKRDNVKDLIIIGEESLLEKLRTKEGKQTIASITNKVIQNRLVIDTITNVIDYKVEKLFTTSLSSYFENLSSDLLRQLESGSVNIIEYIMEHHLGSVFASLNFKNLVKKKIDSFDVLEVERLLLDVIETELKAITWFGAVLGFLLGLITPVISLL